jgi:hypothetical protein
MLTAVSDSQPLDNGRKIGRSTETYLPMESERSDEGLPNDAASDQPTHLEDRSSADTIPQGRPPKKS